MRSIRRSATATALSFAAACAVVLVTAGPASAITASCGIPGDFVSCQTSTIPASSEHWIKLKVWSKNAFAGNVTCRVHDADNGITVGELTTNWWSGAKSRKIEGLYNRYFAVCVGPDQQGGYYGSISNE